MKDVVTTVGIDVLGEKISYMLYLPVLCFMKVADCQEEEIRMCISKYMKKDGFSDEYIEYFLNEWAGKDKEYIHSKYEEIEEGIMIGTMKGKKKCIKEIKKSFMQKKAVSYMKEIYRSNVIDANKQDFKQLYLGLK